MPEQEVPTSSVRRPASIGGLLGPIRIVAARSRFLVVFALVFAVIGGWETIRGYWARLTLATTTEAAISPDTEFFCPMDPGILSDWPSKCPVCNMTLVRRRRGESAPLPDGVMARMQFSPYRLWLGGIKTSTVDYVPLSRSIELPGKVVASSASRVEIEAEAFARERVWIEVGQSVEVVPIHEDGRDVPVGKVQDRQQGNGSGSVGTLKIVIDRHVDTVHVGDRVRLRLASPVDRSEPFRSQATVPPPIGSGETRRLFVCMDHPEIVRDVAGRCPRDGVALMARPLRSDQRVRWWCPMHPGVTADHPGTKCEACGGMILVPRVVSYRPEGKVLAVPCSSVIDVGAKSVVYLDRGDGMFDAKAVTLGPRCGASYPVVSGLEPGDRVVAEGAFLIDAETRLDPGLATGYFGSGPSVASSSAVGPVENGWLAGLVETERAPALAQKNCPVTGKALGSMGVPVKIHVRGRDVFLCCDGCTVAVEADPEKYLAKLPRQDARARP